MTDITQESTAGPIGQTDKNRQILVQNLLRLTALDEITSQFKAAGIPLLYLKGSAYLDTLYPDLGSRKMCDVDVLVQPKHRYQAGQTLESLGFARIGPENRPVTRQEHYEWVYIKNEPFPFVFELHESFCQTQRYPIDYEQIWQRALCYEVRGRSIPTLCPVDSLLYTALHEALHSFIIDHRSSEDMRRIVEVWRPDWHQVVEQAKAWKMTLALYVSLRASELQKGLSVPSWVVKALQPSALRLAALRKIIDLDHTGRSRAQHWNRWQQALALSLSIDETKQLARFVGYYGMLRGRDALRHLLSKL
ncbi:MAG: nucleotidyltransferase family protein [Myxococcales bacterium]|nr:MAG: nucleotidyltransferase family protein [Myxococcales bacterium]